jgi:hypothetical protein
MDIDKALKAAGINRGNVSKVTKPLERVVSDEPAPSPQIEGGRQSDMDKPLKSFEVGRGNEENLDEDLDLMSSDESQPGDDIEEGREMDMDKPLKSFGSGEENVDKVAKALKRVPSGAAPASEDLEGVPDNVGLRPEQYKQRPMDTFTFLILNNVPFAEASVVKYITRWREQGGVEELRKARRMVDMIIEMELNRPMYTPKKASL